MKHAKRNDRLRRGNALVISLIFVIVLSIAAGSILQLTLHSYRLSHRNQLRAQARTVAESELEYMFYQMKTLIVSQGESAANIPDRLSSSSYYTDGQDFRSDKASSPTTNRDAFSAIHRAQGWVVRRSVIVEQGPITATVPGTSKTGTFVYLLVKIEIRPPVSNPFAQNLTVGIGRHVYSSTSSIFQYNIFSQGNLEFLPGGNTVIEGDIAANGSIYMASQASASLTIKGQVRYLNSGQFNSDGDDNTIYREIGSYNSATGTTTTLSNANQGLAAPLDGSGGLLTKTSAQIESMNETENLLGGLDATALAKAYGETSGSTYSGLFGKITASDTSSAAYAEQLAEAENNVYRSLIAPPPEAVRAAAATATTTSKANEVIAAEYPAYTNSSQISGVSDDPGVAALRAYNKAGLIVTIKPDGTIQSIKGKNTASSSAIDLTLLMSGTVNTNKSLTDLRESPDKSKTVAITEIDVGTLKNSLSSVLVGLTGYKFNGLLYVYLANSSSTNPAAVRLINGENTPGSSTGSGFSVATNGGLYVQGDYNTVSSNGATVGSSGAGTTNPAMLMADAITILSDNWTDANSSKDISQRVASSGLTTVAAGLLTGSNAATSTAASGGAQNLVRFLEDWYSPASSVKFYGSIGRLFESNHFIRPFKTGTGVYYQPVLRTFAFNSSLKTQNTPGAPVITAFSRGSFFTWNP